MSKVWLDARVPGLNKSGMGCWNSRGWNDMSWAAEVGFPEEEAGRCSRQWHRAMCWEPEEVGRLKQGKAWTLVLKVKVKGCQLSQILHTAF